MNKQKVRYVSISVMAIAISITIATYNYFYERMVPFEYELCLPKFRNCYPKGIDYVRNKEEMLYRLSGFYHKTSCQKTALEGYDSIYVLHLSKQMDFKKYDYILSYMKKIKSIKHSPYLSKTRDGLYFDKRTPIIAEYKKGTYRFVYIYRIKKNPKFRAPGP